MEMILFYGFGAILIASVLGVIILRNPVHSVLSLILAFFNVAVLFLLLEAEFIAMLIVIVYVGAVAVLFLFIVMMLDVKVTNGKKMSLKHLPAGLFVLGLICVELILALTSSGNSSVEAIEGSSDLSNVEAIGEVLYTEYLVPFQISGLILLVAMIGAIVLTNTKKTAKRQNISEQVNRSSKVELVAVESGKGLE